MEGDNFINFSSEPDPLFQIDCPDTEWQQTAEDQNEERYNPQQNEIDPSYQQFLAYVKSKFSDKPDASSEDYQNETAPQSDPNLLPCLLCQTYKNSRLELLHKNWHDGAKYRCDVCQFGSHNSRFPNQHETTKFHYQQTLKLQSSQNNKKTNKTNIAKKPQTKKRKRVTEKRSNKNGDDFVLITDQDEEYENSSNDDSDGDFIPQNSISAPKNNKNSSKKKLSKRSKISDEEYEISEASEIDEAEEDFEPNSIEKEEGLLRCPIDGCIYFTTAEYNYNFQNHLESDHSKSYPCSACGIETGSHGAWKQHILFNHKNYNFKKCTIGDCIYEGENIGKHKECDHSQPYPCVICGMITGSDGALIQHMRKEHSEEKKCPKCLYIGTHFNITRHVNSEHKPSICFFCNLKTGSNGALMQHLEKEHSGQTQCTLCHKKFKTTRQLHGHMWLRHKKTKNK